MVIPDWMVGNKLLYKIMFVNPQITYVEGDIKSFINPCFTSIPVYVV